MSYGASWGVWWGLSLERPAWASLPPAVIRDQERAGLLPAGTAAQLGGVIVSRRTRRTLRPELVVTSGPQRLAQPGGGMVADLYGSRWALGLYRGGPRLYQARSGVWHDRTDPAALADLDGARHVALAFDQAARPVVAWERRGAVYVRQWSGDSAGYVTRGPWPGRDPLLLADAPLLGVTGDSDVLLLYVDGAALAYRLQREAYSTARALAPLPPGAVLDQVWTGGACWTVAGAGPDGAPLYVESGLYPLRALVGATGAARLSGWMVDTLAAALGAVAATGAASVSGSLVSVSAVTSYGVAASGSAGLSGALAVVLTPFTAEDSATGAAALSGSLAVVLFAVSTQDAATGAATLSGSLT